MICFVILLIGTAWHAIKLVMARTEIIKINIQQTIRIVVVRLHHSINSVLPINLHKSQWLIENTYLIQYGA